KRQFPVAALAKLRRPVVLVDEQLARINAGVLIPVHQDLMLFPHIAVGADQANRPRLAGVDMASYQVPLGKGPVLEALSGPAEFVGKLIQYERPFQRSLQNSAGAEAVEQSHPYRVSYRGRHRR